MTSAISPMTATVKTSMTACAIADTILPDLDTLGGTHSLAFGVSNDGSIIIGESFTAGDTVQRAVRWEGGVASRREPSIGLTSATKSATCRHA
jgi:probable HAF family extracellular repeat protein